MKKKVENSSPKKKEKKGTDWDSLKEKYIFGKYESLSDFARHHGLDPTNGYFRRMTKGWNEEKAKIRQKSAQKSRMDHLRELEETWNKHMADVYVQFQLCALFLEHSSDNYIKLSSEVETLKDQRDFEAALSTRIDTTKKVYDVLLRTRPGTPRDIGEIFNSIDDANLDFTESGMEGLSYEAQVKIFEAHGVEAPRSLRTRFEYEVKRDEEKKDKIKKEKEYGAKLKAILDIRKKKGLGPIETAAIFAENSMELPEFLKLEVKKEVERFSGEAEAIIANHFYSDRDATTRIEAWHKAFRDGLMQENQYVELLWEEDLKRIRKIADLFPAEDREEQYNKMLECLKEKYIGNPEAEKTPDETKKRTDRKSSSEGSPTEV